MHRLLQGEVGSGKTVVALRAMLAVVDAGGQAALLAPTEVLAAAAPPVDHRACSARSPRRACSAAPTTARGSRCSPARSRHGGAPQGRCSTSSAATPASSSAPTRCSRSTVEFRDLGLVVVDEQHRFGVEQRDALRAKGDGAPHVLVMTATPIPRTVAMTVFGDLETSRP